MTLGGIYDIAASLVYGDVAASPPPVAEVPKLQAFILERHRNVQTGYNYWFSRRKVTLQAAEGDETVALPDDFKELVSTNLKVPAYCGGAAFVFDKPLQEDTEFTADYYSYIPTPEWDETHADVVTGVLNWALIYGAVSDVFLSRSSTQEANFYAAKSKEAEFKAEQEDYHRRQAPREIL